MFDYGLLPPEINSGRLYSGPGPGPLLAAAVAWEGLTDDLQAAAAGHRSVITALTSGPWTGPASAAALSAALPFITWLDTSAEQAAEAGAQAGAAATAYEVAFAATVPPPVIAANRALLAALVATNFLGQNTPAIAATEALYAEFWAQDAGAMYTYAGSSAAAAELAELPPPAEVVDPGGLADQAIAAFKAENQVLQSSIINMATQIDLRVTQVLKTLSAPLNGPMIDQWLIANTPLDDVVPLYTKYISPYINSVALGLQSTLWFGDDSAGFAKIGSISKDFASAFAAIEAAEQASAAAAGAGAHLSSVGGVAAGLGKAIPLGGLSVPASWTSATGVTAPGAISLTKATVLPAALETGVGNNMPVAPPFGQFVNAGSGRRTPAYGHRLTFMTRPPAAG